ncbi:MAG: fused MFS/spermidine synthase [Candidatus Aenigmatarchaeota archaeon]
MNKLDEVYYNLSKEIKVKIIGKVIFDKKSEFQHIQIIDTEKNRYLLLDSIVQLSRNDEYIYHESLVHPALLAAKSKNNVLIIGGGDGGSLREVLKYPVKKVTLCELDEEMIKISKKFFPELSNGSFDDPRVEIVYEDGRRFLENSKEKYDVIILDLTDPSGPSKFLFTQEFYSLVSKSLKEGGVVSLDADTPDYWGKFPYIFKTISTVFKNKYPYTVYIPSFMIRIGMIVCSNYDISFMKDEKFVEKEIKKNNLNLNYFTPRELANLFKIEKNINDLLKYEYKISTDKNPIEIDI